MNAMRRTRKARGMIPADDDHRGILLTPLSFTPCNLVLNIVSLGALIYGSNLSTATACYSDHGLDCIQTLLPSFHHHSSPSTETCLLESQTSSTIESRTSSYNQHRHRTRISTHQIGLHLCPTRRTRAKRLQQS